MQVKEIYSICDAIASSAMEVRRALDAGYLEVVYKRALAIELCLRGFDVKVEYPIRIE